MVSWCDLHPMVREITPLLGNTALNFDDGIIEVNWAERL
jgi:hypothetical protein